jgi:hypothetical protein
MRTHLKVSRPSPAFALASVALFVALGGTGYAATQVSQSAKPPSTKQVEALITKYVSAHSTIALVWNKTTTTGSKAVKNFAIGPWTAKVTCSDAMGNQGISLGFKGPGYETAQSMIGGTDSSSPGAAFENYGATTGGGIGVSPGGQDSGTVFLTHGSTVYEVTYNARTAYSGPENNCTLLADVIKLP